MELDTTTTRKTRGKPRGKQTKKSSDFSCYACGKKGHMARDCRSNNKVQRQQFNVTEIKEKDVPHECMSWIACYDDGCLIHLSEKQGSGWFPQQRRGREGFNKELDNESEISESTLLEEHQEAQVVNPAPTEGSDEDEETSEEDDDTDDEAQFKRSPGYGLEEYSNPWADAPLPVCRILHVIAVCYYKVFPGE